MVNDITGHVTAITQLKDEFVAKAIDYAPKLIITIILFIVGLFLIKIIKKAVSKFFKKIDVEKALKTFIDNSISIVLWALLLVIILANLGVNVSGLIAGLGIMGFIVGFALKDTLGNLASGLFILFYKPFKVGDTVSVGGAQRRCGRSRHSSLHIACS